MSTNGSQHSVDAPERFDTAIQPLQGNGSDRLVLKTGSNGPMTTDNDPLSLEKREERLTVTVAGSGPNSDLEPLVERSPIGFYELLPK